MDEYQYNKNKHMHNQGQVNNKTLKSGSFAVQLKNSRHHLPEMVYVPQI